MRALALLGLLGLGLAAGIAVGMTALAKEPTQTVRSTTTRVEVVNGSKRAARTPAPMPTLLDAPVGPRHVSLSSAVPVDANVDQAAYVDRWPQQLIVSWDRAHLTPDGRAAIWQRRGIVIWQLDSRNAMWRRVYTFETLVNNVVGVEGFGIRLGDISGDRRPEVLVFFDTDGSAGGGSYHLFANSGRHVRQALIRRLALDQGTISFSAGHLLVLEGLDYRGPGIHCCYRKVHERWLRWNGERLVVSHDVVRKNQRGWPPG
jgi:hypothetical protein